MTARDIVGGLLYLGGLGMTLLGLAALVIGWVALAFSFKPSKREASIRLMKAGVGIAGVGVLLGLLFWAGWARWPG